MIIHILDRDRSVADAIASVVEAEGFEAIVYENITTLSETKRVSGCDLVFLCDYLPNMPDEVFAKAVRKLPRPARFVFLSNGRSRLCHSVRCAAGNQMLLRKPIHPQQLMAVITV